MTGVSTGGLIRGKYRPWGSGFWIQGNTEGTGITDKTKMVFVTLGSKVLCGENTITYNLVVTYEV